MPYHYLGKSGLKVSRLALGTMIFGGVVEEASAQGLIRQAKADGVNFIDTADVYQKGRSEEIVGRAIKQDRNDWVVATKFAGAFGEGPNQGGISRKWILETVDASLRRLGTDYIDLLYFHRAIFDAPLEEAVRAIGDLIQAGKVRYYGVSNFRGWRIARIHHLAQQNGIDPPIASQPLYNIVNRAAETEQLPAALAYGLGVVSYSPLARGVLTGKYRVDEPPEPGSRAERKDKRILEVEWRRESLELVAKLDRYARNKGTTIPELAIAWVLNNRAVNSLIAGPRTPEQWRTYVKALSYVFTPEDEAVIDSLVAPGHASTPGFTDPSHPVEGRYAVIPAPPSLR
ncbi:MAG TPA: aldo/keto reductase [Polyangiaceae bacterium]|nr:aldo/keto reductase [Polyangiaceae bacterium]